MKDKIFSVLQLVGRSFMLPIAILPVIFAIGVAIGMTKKEKEVAVLSAVVAFFVINTRRKPICLPMECKPLFFKAQAHISCIS